MSRFYMRFLFQKICQRIKFWNRPRENLWKYFAYRPTEKKKGNYFLQKVSGAFQSFGKVSATYVRARNYDDQNTFFDGKSGIMERGRHYIFQLSLQRNPEETKRYVEACFGKSIYSQEYQEKIERKLCVGNHKNCHLLFTKGNSRARGGWPERVRRQKKTEIRSIR